MELTSGLCAGGLEFFHTKRRKPFLYRPDSACNKKAFSEMWCLWMLNVRQCDQVPAYPPLCCFVIEDCSSITLPPRSPEATMFGNGNLQLWHMASPNLVAQIFNGFCSEYQIWKSAALELWSYIVCSRDRAWFSLYPVRFAPQTCLPILQTPWTTFNWSPSLSASMLPVLEASIWTRNS